MDRYRLLGHKDEILQMVKKAPVVDLGEIWQTLPSSRVVYKIKRIEVLTDALIFHCTEDFNLDATYPVFLRINFRNLIFKLLPEDFQTFKATLVCSYPKKAKAIETRSKERTKFPKRAGLYLILRPVSGDTAIDIKVALIDVSDVGLGIKINNLNLDFFRRNKNFRIISVNGVNHIELAMFEVRHISEKEQKSYISIGLLGDIPLSDEFFSVLREELKKNLKK
jgi:hypothetical protein